MSNINNPEGKIPVDVVFGSLSDTISKLNHSELELELQKRGLHKSGSLSELKVRLLQYLNGESIPTDFVSYKEKNSEPIQIDIKSNNMDTKTPYFNPGHFSGLISENIDTFLKQFHRAASVNNWSNEQKIKFIPAFLEGPALIFFENIENNTDENISWPEFEKQFRFEFQTIEQKHMIRTLLEKRKQLDDETNTAFINETESLCKRLDINMQQEEIVRYIMKGLKPNTTRYIGMMDNHTIKNLKENIRKFETIEFLTTREVTQSPTDIKNSITHESNKIKNEPTQRS